MNLPIVILFKRKQFYLAIFLPTLLIGYVTTGSANAADGDVLTQMDSSTPTPMVEPTPDREYRYGIGVSQSAIGIPIPTGKGPVKGPTDSDQLAPTNWIIMDPPTRSPKVTFYDPDTGVEVTKPWAVLTNKQILRLLSNTTTEISVGKVDAYGKASYVVATATGEIGAYRVIMDFTPYMVEEAIGLVSKIKIGEAKIGVGLRLTADVTTNTANIDLGSLMALGVAANLKQLQGTMRIDSIGIRLKDDSGIMLSSTKIDETGISKTLQTLAVVQSKIADETTYLDPHIISVKPMSYKYKPLEISKNIQGKPVTEKKRLSWWEKRKLNKEK